MKRILIAFILLFFPLKDVTAQNVLASTIGPNGDYYAFVSNKGLRKIKANGDVQVLVEDTIVFKHPLELSNPAKKISLQKRPPDYLAVDPDGKVFMTNPLRYYHPEHDILYAPMQGNYNLIDGASVLYCSNTGFYALIGFDGKEIYYTGYPYKIKLSSVQTFRMKKYTSEKLEGQVPLYISRDLSNTQQNFFGMDTNFLFHECSGGDDLRFILAQDGHLESSIINSVASIKENEKLISINGGLWHLFMNEKRLEYIDVYQNAERTLIDSTKNLIMNLYLDTVTAVSEKLETAMVWYQQEPDDAMVLYMIGSELSSSGEFEEGLSYLLRAEKIRPKNELISLYLIQSLYALDRFEDISESRCERVMSSNQCSEQEKALVYYISGYCQLLEKDYFRSLELFKESANLYPTTRTVLFLAYIKFKLKDDEPAKKRFGEEWMLSYCEDIQWAVRLSQEQGTQDLIDSYKGQFSDMFEACPMD